MARLKGSKTRVNRVKIKRFKASIYRLNISYLSGFGTYLVLSKGTKRLLGTSPELDRLKSDVLHQILKNQNYRHLRYYNIAWQIHPSTGQPHLDILLVYDKAVQKSPSSYNYLLPLCPQRQSSTTPGVFITGYSKTRFNKAILQYGSKEDPNPLSTLPEDLTSFLDLKKLQDDPYFYLYDKMKQDPLNFNLEQYVQKNQLSQYIKGWSSIKTKLKDMQVAAANLSLKSKPGFKPITRDHIEEKLSPSELKQFDSWKGYQTIINHLNQMVLLKGNRQQKSLNLLITGAPNTGKSALVWQRNPLPGRTSISSFCSVYPIGMQHWFPKYQSDVYHCIYWNQMKLTSYSYDTILKLLDGSPLDLPNKGGTSRKIDNPLIIMTSNMTLEQMIKQKFGYSKQYLQMARKNLAVRVQNVVVPKGYDLFLLQKILIS